MCGAQPEARTGVADHCSWRGDSPEPEHNDLIHKIRPPYLRDKVCDWRGDPPEPEFDDLTHGTGGKQSLNLSPKSQATSRVAPHLVEVEPKPLDTPATAERPHDHQEIFEVPSEDEQPHDEDQGEQDNAAEETLQEETLQEKITHGVQQALNVLQSIVSPSSVQGVDGAEPNEVEDGAPLEPSELPPPTPVVVEPQVRGKKSKEDKIKAKREREAAKKAEKERKAKEKEEKKRLKIERRRERKEQRLKEKEKRRNKGKGTEPPPPDLPADTHDLAAAGSHPHPGCQICQHPEEQGTLDFMKESLENWGGLPSLHDLTEAAKKLLGLGDTEKADDVQKSSLGHSQSEQDLIEHIAAHIDRHIHQHMGDDPPRGGDSTAEKAPLRALDPQPDSFQRSVPSGKQQENGENGRPTSHGLDGNRDWPVTLMQGHALCSKESTPAPDAATTQSTSQTYSPVRAPLTRCVSPWCEQLGIKLDDSPPYPKQNPTWLRSGFNPSPSRLRTVTTAPCLNGSVCPYRIYHEPGLYACVPVSLLPALSVESPYCGHSNCHYVSPIMTPVPVLHAPHAPFSFEPFGTAETIRAATPRRSVSVNETRIAF